MFNPINKFLHFQKLPATSLTRRQLLLSSLGLAFAAFGTHSALARTLAASGGKKIVVIDPGHGGIDPGAIGHGGTKEKHVVLEIANYVKEYLAGHSNIDVRLTRETDHFIPLYQRIDIAHQHRANLFVSIHADGYTDSTASGASVYALSNQGASSAMADYMSQNENDADRVAGAQYADKDNNHLQEVLFDLEQTDTIKNSLILGHHVLQHIKPVHHLHSGQTEQAAFAVLKSPSIPSILVETSFITNHKEEQLLDTSAFRRNMAQAIAHGIVNFFDYFEATERRHR
jgi:N-acetylmuramoyl-L-alanine amidase